MPTTSQTPPADPSLVVRPFRRDDRDQLTALVNAHVAAVVPGLTVSVNTVLTQPEREPGEFVVDHWVANRHALVAVQRGRLVAAAYLVTYRNDPDVSAWARGRGEVRWLLCWPDAPFWPDAGTAGRRRSASSRSSSGPPTGCSTTATPTTRVGSPSPKRSASGG